LLTFNNSKNKTRVHRTRERRRAEVVLSLRWILFVITAPESNAPSCFFRRNNFRRTTDNPRLFPAIISKNSKMLVDAPGPLDRAQQWPNGLLPITASLMLSLSRNCSQKTEQVFRRASSWQRTILDDFNIPEQNGPGTV
jgi:hypothetical protein